MQPIGFATKIYNTGESHLLYWCIGIYYHVFSNVWSMIYFIIFSIWKNHYLLHIVVTVGNYFSLTCASPWLLQAGGSSGVCLFWFSNNGCEIPYIHPINEFLIDITCNKLEDIDVLFCAIKFSETENNKRKGEMMGSLIISEINLSKFLYLSNGRSIKSEKNYTWRRVLH